MSDRDGIAWGTALREHRIRNGMTQQQLADLAGVSVRTVRSIERGTIQHPRQASLRQLADVLQRTPGQHGVGQLHIDILGPLVVRRGDQAIEIRSTHQRCLLGLLALHAGHIVSCAEIIDVLWDDRPPPTFQTMLHTAISRLRKTIDDRPNRIIANRRNGYLLEIDNHCLDVTRFTALHATARQTPDPDEALGLLDHALACWRGPVLSDLPERLRQHPAAVAASQRRLSAALTHADIAADRGRHDQAAAQLRTIVHDEPFHEGVHARLMQALAGAGQPAAALTLFAQIRDRLRVELAVTPGEELRTAHRKVVRGQISAQVTHTRNFLPRDLTDFTGRDKECHALLNGHAAEGVTAINGMAGTGKTALAVHLAHELASHYPDGQLFLDLHAHTADREPPSARDALESLLRQFGVEGERIPQRVDDCAALWRALTANRRLFVVLDNATDAAQVRPLLPNGRFSRTLITSRSRLASLEGVHHLSVTVLPHTDATTLFIRAFGRSVAGQDDAMDEVLRLCGYLPLAVRIAAAKARGHPSWTVAHLADRLRDEHRRLSELHVGDRSVEAAFSVSYRQLDEPQQQMFRLLGGSPTHDFDTYTAAALADISCTDAERLLDNLLDSNLLLEPVRGRFTFHDLLRQYARAAARHHPAWEGTNAQVQLADYYLRTANHAADLLEPTRRRWSTGTSSMDLPQFSGPAEAVAWLEVEHENLVAIVAAASACGQWNLCWQLTQCLWRYFFLRGHLQDWVVTHDLALKAVHQTDDTRAEAEVRKNLGLAHWRRADFSQALNQLHKALAIDERDTDVWGQAKTHNHLGFVHARMGHHAQAIHHQKLAVKRYRQARDRTGQMWAQIGLGDAYFQASRSKASRMWFARALSLTQVIGYRPGEVLALIGLGFARHKDGRPQLNQALELARAIGDRWSECLALTGIGTCDHLAGARNSALDRLRQAVALARETGDRWVLRLALTQLGRVHSELGRHDEAITMHTEALALSRALCNQHLEREVLSDLTDTHSAHTPSATAKIDSSATAGSSHSGLTS
jgi:DNA-binding SARP family transcriptional activator/tetratricopeptide (TPR) repeat protein/DNA-binding XRE family transcriptional regulator